MIETVPTDASEMKAKLGKEYKLCSKIAIDSLFEKGITVKQYPLRLLYKEPSEEHKMTKPFQIVIAVPKRNVRKAHDRNRIKRLLKEIIRHNKNEFEETLISKQKKLALFLIYSEKTELEYAVLEKKVNKIFAQLIIQLNND